MVCTGRPKIKGNHNQNVADNRNLERELCIKKQKACDHSQGISHVNANIFINCKQGDNAPHTKHAEIPTNNKRSLQAVYKSREPQNHKGNRRYYVQLVIIDLEQMNSIPDIYQREREPQPTHHAGKRLQNQPVVFFKNVV